MTRNAFTVLAFTALLASPVQAQSTQTSVKVFYGDLDLSKPAGMQTLQNRLRVASGDPGEGGPGLQAEAVGVHQVVAKPDGVEGGRGHVQHLRQILGEGARIERFQAAQGGWRVVAEQKTRLSRHRHSPRFSIRRCMPAWCATVAADARRGARPKPR